MFRPFNSTISSLLCAAACLTLASGCLQAQDAERVHIVTYFEVANGEADTAAGLLRRHRQASRNSAGNLHFEVLQRIGRPNHFVILELWETAAAKEVHTDDPATQGFLEALEPMRISPYDQREHTGLSVAADSVGEGTVYAVTHVDIVPTYRETGVELVVGLTETSRSDPGNIRFDALTQSSRTNHMTLVELWQNEAALQNHAMTAHKIEFRHELAPLSGSLYDERLYRAIR